MKKPMLMFRIGRKWGQVDLISLLNKLNLEKSKTELKRLWIDKAIDFKIIEK